MSDSNGDSAMFVGIGQVVGHPPPIPPGFDFQPRPVDSSAPVIGDHRALGGRFFLAADGALM